MKSKCVLFTCLLFLFTNSNFAEPPQKLPVDFEVITVKSISPDLQARIKDDLIDGQISTKPSSKLDSNGIRYVLRPEKTTFRLNEPIFVKLVLQCVDRDNGLIFRDDSTQERFTHQWKVQRVEESGKVSDVPFLEKGIELNVLRSKEGFIIERIPNPFCRPILIRPGTEYPISGNKEPLTSLFDFSVPGKYRISSVRKLCSSGGEFDPPLESNEMEITISGTERLQSSSLRKTDGYSFSPGENLQKTERTITDGELSRICLNLESNKNPKRPVMLRLFFKPTRMGICLTL